MSDDSPKRLYGGGERSAGDLLATLKTDLENATWSVQTGSTGPLTLNSDGSLTQTADRDYSQNPTSVQFTARATAGSETDDQDIEVVLTWINSECWALNFDYDYGAIPLDFAPGLLRLVSDRLNRYHEYRIQLLHGDAKPTWPRVEHDAAQRTGVRDLLRPYLRVGVGGL